MRHRERHKGGRAGWLRAAVLGANDGLISTSALVVGVAAANSSAGTVLVAGLAGLVGGALDVYKRQVHGPIRLRSARAWVC